jgi:hypothetical protein
MLRVRAVVGNGFLGHFFASLHLKRKPHQVREAGHALREDLQEKPSHDPVIGIIAHALHHSFRLQTEVEHRETQDLETRVQMVECDLTRWVRVIRYSLASSTLKRKQSP